MVNKYRRAARSAEELGLGALRALDQVIPELAPEAKQTPKSEGVGSRVVSETIAKNPRLGLSTR
jgi:hypothetical protein